MQKLLLIELNEINFDFIRAYGRSGALPNLTALIERHGVTETTSESRYEDLEPWIQWVTAHTGLSLAEHGVFRLGDIVNHDIPQIWEQLEASGRTVGAISPMNAKNRTRAAKFFVPDPWTDTPVTGSFLMRKLYEAIAQAVNDNAKARLTPTSAFWLAVGLAVKARPENYGRYLGLVMDSVRKPWSRALVLDLLLADIFQRETRRTRPDFASLFLNAGAHIQHHYMYSSAAYEGPMRNPSWYVNADADPLLDVYRLYDRILGAITRDLADYRIMLATGLHQVPHEEATYYWRLKDHDGFLRRLGVSFSAVSPRMSRDFLISCDSVEDAAQTEAVLRSAKALADGQALFEIDNRGADLFVSLAYANDIPANLEWQVGNRRFTDLRADVAFVAVKNGEHDGVGYFLDTGAQAEAAIPLKTLPDRIKQALAA